MRKTTFTKSEYAELKKLISQKVLADRSEQKRIRDKIRKIGFHYSDFSSKKGYNVSDLEELVRNKQIKLIGGSTPEFKPKPTTQKAEKKVITTQLKVNLGSLEKMTFRNFNELSDSTLSKTGLYFIKLKNGAKLPTKYQNILDQRSHRIIYIGKAQGQSLRERLSQEIYHTSPGTFFRSIGAVLNFKPIPGHLKGKRNQKNYKFSPTDTNSISNWLIINTEYVIKEVQGDFSVEDELIRKYCPLLNDKSNPLRLSELREDRKKCREIAVG
jgi:hypothetical protein|tara:strand:- start:73 stop:882 length:810 start_codon:yes stop_codon:yes gene_type:complete